MVILALETATRRGSVALFADGECHAEEGDEHRTHGERLPGAATDWLRQLGRTVRDVDAFAIVAGPGSFTGIRVGMAAVQGLALATGKRVIPVPTLDAVASGWLERRPAGAPAQLVAACLDGQRGDVFVAAFECVNGGGLDQCRRVLPPQAARPADAAAGLAALRSPLPMVLVGDGALAHESVFRAALPGVRIDPLAVPIALPAVRLAADRVSESVAPHALRPIYLRRPDQDLARDRSRLAPAMTIGVAGGADDVGAVEALQRRAFTNAWGAEAIRWELENTDVARLYVARATDGSLVGYCACWMIFDELHINSLAVEDAWRRRGVARRLLAHVLEAAIASGATSATLEVRASNQAARALYEGLGFRVEGVRRDYYQEPREDALILWNRDLRHVPKKA
jgi:tRNA threonylcarbamoyl adenosine modification protein YeaZ/ribosomal-protein-alanine acetyltransferase